MRILAQAYNVTPVIEPTYMLLLKISIKTFNYLCFSIFINSLNSFNLSDHKGTFRSKSQENFARNRIRGSQLNENEESLRTQLGNRFDFSTIKNISVFYTMWGHISKYCRINADIALKCKAESISHLWNMVSNIPPMFNFGFKFCFNR